MCVVGNYAESGVRCVLFHDSPESHLRYGSHGVGFVEDDELECADCRGVAWFGHCCKDLLRACEGCEHLLPQARGNVEFNILAKVLICSRTTSMPLSSEALSSRTICLMFLGPYIRLARARIVDVLPVPGGP